MEWIQDLVDAGHLSESEAWRPWFNTQWPGMPAGYVTAYNVTGAPSKDFHFLTIRLAGQYCRAGLVLTVRWPCADVRWRVLTMC